MNLYYYMCCAGFEDDVVEIKRQVFDALNITGNGEYKSVSSNDMAAASDMIQEEIISFCIKESGFSDNRRAVEWLSKKAMESNRGIK